MLNRLKRVICLTALGAVILGATEGEAMNQVLSEPAAVPLDFLAWIDRDAGWLRERLAAQDVRSGFAIEGGVLVATTVDALRVANRIRSFAFLAAPGLRPPYFDLRVEEAGRGLVRCVTLFPRSIVPELGPLDFERASFPAAGADPKILDLCRVSPASGVEYQRMARTAFRERYFDAAGDLKVEFATLNSDAAFVAQAIDHGFFVFQQDLTGRLRLGPE